MSDQIYAHPITHPSAWFGRNLANDPSWLVYLDEQDLRDIAEAVRAVRARGLSLGQVGRGSFPLPNLAPKLARWLEEIRTGRGFVLVRGLNTADYSDDDVGLIFWGIGSYLGMPVRQNPQGDLLGHVYDHGRRYGDIDVRGYETNAHLPFHSDGCDLVGLLCLRRAKSGGLSSIVSSVTLHNEILRLHPEYLPPLYRGFHYIKREAALTADPVTQHRVPVFGAKDGTSAHAWSATRSMQPARRPASRSSRWSRRRSISSTALLTTPPSISTWICRSATCSFATTTRCCIPAPASRTIRSRCVGAI